jgi:beta-lactamase class A
MMLKKLSWRTWLAISAITFVLFFILLQLFYSSERLLPFISFDSISVGGQEKSSVIHDLNQRLQSQKVAIYFTNSDQVYRSPSANQLGIRADTMQQITAMDYPWYMRLIPTSLLWYGLHQNNKPITYKYDKLTLDTYTEKELGASCKVTPKDASLILVKSRLELQKSSSGGMCATTDVRATLMKVQPRLSMSTKVNIEVKKIPPEVSDASANNLATKLNNVVAVGVPLKVGDQTQTIPTGIVLSWLDFTPSGKELAFSINKTRANDYFKTNVTPKLTIAAGITNVTTLDFTETTRQDGAKGQTLNTDATVQNITKFLQQESASVVATPAAVEPKVNYTRQYTHTSSGINALLANYAKDHPGTYGISFSEIGGQTRTAQYNGSKVFTTASTYKLFVALGTLTRVEKGTWQWSDQITGGRDLTKCFDDMIVKSDNACAEALLSKIGFKALTNEIREVGLTNSGFMGTDPQTTAQDLVTYLTKLELAQLPINSDSRNRLLGAMKRNIYRSGVPAGTGGTVANKVGFLSGLFHDAAIVYSPNGTYILTIMTDGSTWGNIAELTRQIESLRS